MYLSHTDAARYCVANLPQHMQPTNYIEFRKKYLALYNLLRNALTTNIHKREFVGHVIDGKLMIPQEGLSRWLQNYVARYEERQHRARY